MVAMSEVVAHLDLGTCETREEFVEALQSTRAFQLEALERGFPDWMNAVSRKGLRSTRLAEIALCEEVLSGIGEPFEAPENAPVPTRYRPSPTEQFAAAAQHDLQTGLKW